jgi:hypothetical protein
MYWGDAEIKDLKKRKLPEKSPLPYAILLYCSAIESDGTHQVCAMFTSSHNPAYP